MNHTPQVNAVNIDRYDQKLLARRLPDSLFETIRSHQTVILKPNWVTEAHKDRPQDWEYVITHPAVISAVLEKVVARLDGRGGSSLLTDLTPQPLLPGSFPAIRWQLGSGWPKKTGSALILLTCGTMNGPPVGGL